MTNPLVYSAPAILWEKSYGGSLAENVISVQQTLDGGFIFVGETRSFGNPDGNVWLVKVDANGDTLWTKTFGHSEHPRGLSVRQTTDGGYIVTGASAPDGSSGSNVELIKTDASGESLWKKTYDKNVDVADAGLTVEQTGDGGYVVLATTIASGGSISWLIKTDAAGDTLWSKTFAEGKATSEKGLALSSDGGYVFTGETRSGDVLIMKIDKDGNTVWTKVYDGSGLDSGRAIANTNDGGYIVTGYTGLTGGRTNVWLLKTDAAGDTIWTKVYGGDGHDQARSVQQTSDGGYFVTAITFSIGAGKMDAWILKTDAAGDTTWTMTWGGAENDNCSFGQQIKDGGYIVSAYTNSFSPGNIDGWLVRLAVEKPKKIIWVNDHNADSLWVEKLQQEGYFVQVETATMQGTLTQAQKDVMESGDLVICSSANTSSNYEDAPGINSITTPLIMMNGSSARKNRWQWFNTSFSDELLPAPCVVQNPDHPIFKDVMLDADNKCDMLLPEIGSGRTLFIRDRELSGESGEILASREDNGAAWIAFWGYGDPFYEDATTPIPAGIRLMFAAGAMPGFRSGANYPGGEYNVTPAGEKMFLNAVAWILLPETNVSDVQDSENQMVPTEYALKGNYPNPFNPETTIQFTVPKRGALSLKVYNMMGQEIVTLVDSEYLAGTHNVRWNGRDRFDNTVSSGIYFYKMEANGTVKSNKMLLIK